MPKVCIVGLDQAVSRMFMGQGWTPVSYIDETVSLIQFVGGEDVDPSYYKETRHPATRSNPERDARESVVYQENLNKIPMAGICRGAQFLNVMNGGSLWQNVTNHAIMGTHEAFCRVFERPLEVTSTHHQMMRTAPGGNVLLTAQVCEIKSTPDQDYNGLLEPDVEAVWYPETQCLCYQPHPEYVNINHECQQTYFQYLEKFLV